MSRASCGWTRTRRSCACCARTGACCASRATSTRTRTAGAAATRSSTRPSRAGSCASPTIKDRLIENNEQITWVPENVKHGQFGKWLEGARDWSISRNRYWGSPIPVWKSDDPEYPRVDVYGSLEEIERDFGRLPRNAAGEVDLHRPYIDDLTRPNPDDPTGQSTMRRIEDVLDVWFDSGVDALRAGALPVREPRLVRRALARRLHRRVHRADARLVLRHARAVDGAVRPARRSPACRATASCSAATG